MTEAEFQKGGFELSQSETLKMSPEFEKERESFAFRPVKVYKPEMAKYSPALKREIFKALVKQKQRKASVL